MSPVANVTIHASQFPEQVHQDLLTSFRTRQINHKFHYDSIKQTQKWLALHQAYSPARTDPQCMTIYEAAFSAAARILPSEVRVIGLGCGGGQKDVRLLQLLKESDKKVSYMPSDVSTAMVLVARQAALKVISERECVPLVCDLATAGDIREVLDTSVAAQASRLITFFGMIPNFEPALILSRLARLVRREDQLLFSANLSPGADYVAGLERILPLYDNELTRDWLMTVLLDAGIERADGELVFGVENDPAGGTLKRIGAYFRFTRARTIHIGSEEFRFQPGDKIRLFYSYRHTPDLVKELLEGHGLQVKEQWITDSEEEGVFLCRRT